jgi:hypothetical protein
VLETFGDDRGNFIRRATAKAAPPRVDLVDVETGEVAGGFDAYSLPDMTTGLIDDRSRYWLRSADRLYSRPVSLSEYAQIAARCAALSAEWIADLFPAAVVARDPGEWRVPTAWEIRHIVGEGSFTGLSGAKAAELVGVTPQNFRKYTARDGASTRQAMSYAMWHLLLHKLGVQRA